MLYQAEPLPDAKKTGQITRSVRNSGGPSIAGSRQLPSAIAVGYGYMKPLATVAIRSEQLET